MILCKKCNVFCKAQRPMLTCSRKLHPKFYFLFLFPLPTQLSSILRIKVPKPSSYHDAKQAAMEYHSAKKALIKAFHKAGLGAWVKKPIEQDQFTLSSWLSPGTKWRGGVSQCTSSSRPPSLTQAGKRIEPLSNILFPSPCVSYTCALVICVAPRTLHSSSFLRGPPPHLVSHFWFLGL